MDAAPLELETFIDALSIGVCIWQLGEPGERASLVLRACNPAAAKFLSVERDAVIGRRINEGFPGALETPLPGVFTKVIESGEIMELGDVPYQDEIVPDGVFSIRVSPLPGQRALVEFTNVTKERRAQAEAQRILEETKILDEKLGLIESQKREIQQLTAPILELWTGVLTLPLVGRFDDERNEVVREKLLAAIADKQARQVIIDVTGLESIDEGVADDLVHLSQAAALLGARTYFSGISPANALTMAKLDHGQLANKCLRNLRDALGVVMGQRER
ncbi:STAS domain-containing protein [Pseudenhygromyxa sp. WMMC2535]|uniref:STAS domain-containing protein n=1 Tax=Pseudenhygromyxa sp. WMMC2535 TaxID=2712867 RepID=UPI001556CE2D|nr:STAS domain-containing protein [Pseudenhygromyxa sp. WMMC2535]NVB39337.1 STAS domain-containing protein [Pseudenhygromyxa sp. WMMC2535]